MVEIQLNYLKECTFLIVHHVCIFNTILDLHCPGREKTRQTSHTTTVDDKS